MKDLKEIILATTNKGKLVEFNQMAKHLGIKFKMVDMPEIDENGTTFEENSLIKAKTIAQMYKEPTLSDDSGLCIDALNGGPGIHTARYKKELPTQEDKLRALIEDVNNANSTRDAKFVCVLTLYMPDGKFYHFRGESKGKITNELRGTNGHGYDPIFYSTDLSKTFAEASIDEKDSVSHRGRAFMKFEEFLND